MYEIDKYVRTQNFGRLFQSNPTLTKSHYGRRNKIITWVFYGTIGQVCSYANKMFIAAKVPDVQNLLKVG